MSSLVLGLTYYKKHNMLLKVNAHADVDANLNLKIQTDAKVNVKIETILSRLRKKRCAYKYFYAYY